MQAKRTRKTPGPDHPITIESARRRVVIRHGGHIIADTEKALTLRESDYDAVHYIPRADVDMSLLERTSHGTYCPYKGDASYYTIAVAGAPSENAVWTYETPHQAVKDIKDHLAFYPERVDAIEVELRN